MTVVFEISNIPNRVEAVARKLDFAEAERGLAVIRSAMPADTNLNEHLVWLWGRLKHERSYLKNLQQDGAVLTVRIKRAKGKILIEANGAEMIHLLNARLLIEA